MNFHTSSALEHYSPAPMFMEDPLQGIPRKPGEVRLIKSDRGSSNRSAKSIFTDPMSLVYSMGYKDRRVSIAYDALRHVYRQLSLLGSIIKTRQDQVTAFCSPARLMKNSSGVGFEIKLKDADSSPSDSDKKKILDLENFIMDCGRPSGKERREDFETFTRKFIQDLLILDQGCFEIVPDMKGRPYEFLAIDGGTIRIAAEDGDWGQYSNFVRNHRPSINQLTRGTNYDPNPLFGRLVEDVPPGKVKYVQLIRGQIETLYRDMELAFCCMNPSSDIYTNGYGVSNIELLVRIVTAHLFAEQYNVNAFTQGSMPKGILNVKDHNADQKYLEFFRRQWQSNVVGVNNAFRTPIMQGSAIEYINLQSSNVDMEYQRWLEYLVRTSCFIAETPVVTDAGTQIPIVDIKPGQLVRTHSGKAKKVLNVQISDYKGDLVNIKAGGKLVSCTPEHPFLVRTSYLKSYHGKSSVREFDEPEWVRAEDIVEAQDYLIVPKTEKKEALQELCEKFSSKNQVHETETTFLVPVSEVFKTDFEGKVYNLEVEDEHTYQVDHFAVHNCSLFGIDPAEVGYEFTGAEQTHIKFDTQAVHRLQKSKDRGLRPLLRFYAKTLTKYIVERIDDRFYLDFVGLDELTQKERQELRQAEVTTYKTLNEVRHEEGLDPLPYGDLVLNATLLQYLQMQENQRVSERDFAAAEEEKQYQHKMQEQQMAQEQAAQDQANQDQQAQQQPDQQQDQNPTDIASLPERTLQ